ncbi:MAG: hypothetical protein M1818_002219 [Claussenomyces sp. TS43310]|nr:MAG: hypothetical protein M1818_002219 [Claussenomyces sp. TS43310]
MARKPTPQPLAIPPPISKYASGTNSTPLSASAASAKTPKTPRSSFRFTSKTSQSSGDQPSMQAAERGRRKGQPSIPSSQPSKSLITLDEPGRERSSTSPARGGPVSNNKLSKSSSRPLLPESTIRQVAEEAKSRDSERPAVPRDAPVPEPSKNEKTSIVSHFVDTTVVNNCPPGSTTVAGKAIVRRPVGGHTKSDTSISIIDSSAGGAAPSTSIPSTTSPSVSTNNASIRKQKPKPFSLLSRTRSIRHDKDGQSPNELVPIIITEPERAPTSYGGMKTAPLRPDYDTPFRDMMNSAPRNRSADRQAGNTRSSERDPKENARTHPPITPRDYGSSSYLSLMKSSSSKAVSMGRGIFSKVGRSYSGTEKESSVDDENYSLKVINLPLVEQTRLTRISKKLETSRDKTEYWMPAFPWRAIDYLNYRGTETEGLYRVPGSGPQIKRWQRRFDEELDVDLFEQEDLYDINIIGSMLKAWLRELPDELFPKAAQDRVAKECSGSEEVPQLLIDEISNLPPYNYYLLFAITCHLSLLLNHSDKNKMDFRNLCICFQPCMKIDAFCFKFLVVDWAACWKGCKTEKTWMEQEHQLFDPVPPSSGESISSAAVESHDERNVSSSDSSKPSSVNNEHSNTRSKPKPKPLAPRSTSSLSSQDTSSTTTTMTAQEQRTPRLTRELQPLAPIQPLSPMSF